VLLKADTILLQVAVRLVFFGKNKRPARGGALERDVSVRSLQAMPVSRADLLRRMIMAALREAIRP
jgi:hypothetical protein